MWALLSVGDGFVEFPASCIGVEDGYQWLKPLEGEEHPPINQKCVGEYMVIDVDRDQNVQHYFSSFDSWHYALRGPAIEDSVNWEEWWLPNALFLDAQKEPNHIALCAQIEGDDAEEAAQEEVDDILVRARSKLKVLQFEQSKMEQLAAEQQQQQSARSQLTAHHLLTPLALNSKSAPTEDEAVGVGDGDEYFSYILSADCSSCDVAENVERNELRWSNDDESGDRTAYYMTSSMFGCDAEPTRWANCQWDEERYQCSFCSSADSDGDLGYRRTRFPEQSAADSLRMGLCGLWPQSSYSGNVAEDRTQCLFGDGEGVEGGGERTEWIKPSIGSDGRHCVCVRPSASLGGAKWRSSPTVFEGVAVRWLEAEGEGASLNEVGFVDDVHELWQSDFVDGTYRITESGTYVVMEDITFDFNAGDWERPNEGSSWWPTADQMDQYPGAGGWRDEYFMGFWAGITVEADSVVLDLGGHTLAMSRPFYLQQRFFSVIALKSAVFPLNQGPGLFGSDPVFASSVVIRNGEIGLSSHHGIHGHFNDDVTIDHVHVRDFETHGVEFSHFRNLKLRRIEIGPSSTSATLNGARSAFHSLHF